MYKSCENEYNAFFIDDSPPILIRPLVNVDDVIESKLGTEGWNEIAVQPD